VLLRNQGRDTIRTVELQYRVGGQLSAPAVVPVPPIATNGTAWAEHPDAWSPAPAGTFAHMSVWITRLNGVPDELPADDTVEASPFINNGVSARKRVLIEEFSTAPCGYCPDGHVKLEELLVAEPDAVGVTHHAGYLTDAMTIPASAAIADAFTNGAPTAAIDRILWQGQNIVAISRTEWAARAAQALTRQAPLSVVPTPLFDPVTRRLDVAVFVEAMDYPLPGSLRTAVLVVEDHVVGQGPGYDQSNYYNDTPGSPFYQRGNPIAGYDHRRVVRAVVPAAWGDSLLLPMALAPGHSYRNTYSWTVPQDLNPEHMSVLALVFYRQDGLSEVLNVSAAEGVLSDVSPLPATPDPAVCWPVPSRGWVQLSCPALPGASRRWMLVDALGRTAHAGVVEADADGQVEARIDLRACTPGASQVLIDGFPAPLRRPVLIMR
jgi:hypothetical protein